MDHFENKFAFIEDSIAIRMESVFTEISKLEENLINRINLFEKNLIKNYHAVKDSNNFSRIKINLWFPVWRCIGSFNDQLSYHEYREDGEELKFVKDEVLVQQILSELW